MKERLINEFLGTLGDLDVGLLEVLRNKLSLILDNYDVKIAEKGLVPVEGYIPSVVKDFIAIKKIEGKSDTTLRLYYRYLCIFFDAVRRPPEQITANVIRMFLYQYQQERGTSNRTLDTIRSCLSAFFSWATSEGYIQKDPCLSVAPIKYQEAPREALSDMELEMLRKVCTSPRDSLIVEFLYSTGCRVSEFVNVRLEDINLREHEVKVSGKGNKTRLVYLNAKAEIAIRGYLKATGRDFFHMGYLLLPSRERASVGPCSTRTVENRVHDLGELAGIQRRVHPHLLRHTFATNCVNRNVPVQNVQKMLGHSKIETTMIYAHVDESRLQSDHVRCIV